MRGSHLRIFFGAMDPYMLFEIRICLFLVLATLPEGVSPLLPQNSVPYAGDSLNGEKSVDIATSDPSSNTDDVRHYVTYLMFSCLHSLIMNCNLHSEEEIGMVGSNTF